MITLINANVFTTNAEIIAHQVNCLGSMGSGVARQVKKKFPKVFKTYVDFCDSHPTEDLLGKTQFVVDKKIIANLFGQLDHGNRKRYTSYEALKKCFATLDEYAHKNKYKIAMPYGIGCGLGGGDWDIVYKLMQENIRSADLILYSIKSRKL